MNFFTHLEHPESLWFLLFLLGAFLLGLLTGYLIWGRKLGALRAQIADWEGRYNKLQGEYNDLEGRYSNLELTLNDSRKETASWEARYNDLKIENGQLHGDILSARNKAKELETQLDSGAGGLGDDALKLSLKEQKDKLALASSNLDKSQAEVGSYKARISDLEAKLAACAKDRERLENENKGADTKPEASAEKSKDDLAAELSSAKADIAAALGSRIPVATADQKDDLKKISGVGPFIEKKLNGLGIYTFNQVAKFDDDLVDKVNLAIEFFPGRIRRDDWISQSKELHKEKYG